MAVSSRRQFSAEKGICHMSETTITQLPDPSGFSSDPFTEVLRNGARDLSGRQTPSQAPLPQSDIEQSAPKDASAARPGSPWPSS